MVVVAIHKPIAVVTALVAGAGFLPADARGEDPGSIEDIAEVFDRPAKLAKAAGPVTCILDTEHPDTVKTKISEKPVPDYKGRVLQRRVVEITGLPCILVHHAEVTRKDFERPNLRAVLLMARSKSINATLDRELYALIRETKVPMIGFCGGLHLIVQAYGGRIEFMRELQPGETDPNPKYQPGWLKEWGFLPVRATRSDPLFAGLPDPFVVREWHAWEVVDLPAEFEILAATAECAVQVAGHRDRPLYGTQFHPEAYDDRHPDGRKLLENFFRLAGIVLPGSKAVEE